MSDDPSGDDAEREWVEVIVVPDTLAGDGDPLDVLVRVRRSGNRDEARTEITAALAGAEHGSLGRLHRVTYVLA